MIIFFSFSFIFFSRLPIARSIICIIYSAFSSAGFVSWSLPSFFRSFSLRFASCSCLARYACYACFIRLASLIRLFRVRSVPCRFLFFLLLSFPHLLSLPFLSLFYFLSFLSNVTLCNTTFTIYGNNVHFACKFILFLYVFFPFWICFFLWKWVKPLFIHVVVIVTIWAFHVSHFVLFAPSPSPSPSRFFFSVPSLPLFQLLQKSTYNFVRS